MHDNITTRIIEYLQLDTSYAIILNGNYGVGKTHYIKTELFPKIKEVKIKGCNDKYKPVLVSLFGAKTIEDIQDRIFIALYSLLGKKGVKLAGSLGAVVMNRFGFNARDIKNAVRESKESLTDYSKILICIDDIDRKSIELDLAEVLGFVNNLVENFNAKVLLITNEGELRKNKDAKKKKHVDYSLLKEKVIGVTMNFDADTSKIIDEIIESKYEDKEKSYFDFLTKHMDVINQRITQNKGNLRNLLFFLEHFKKIFKQSEKLLSEDKKSDEIKNGVLEGILNLALPVSIEYKMGKLHDDNINEIKEYYQNPYGWIGDIDTTSDGEEVKPNKQKRDYPEKYREKYLLGVKYTVQNIYYESVFDDLVGKTVFDKEKFERELSLTDWYKENEIHERDKVIEKILQWDFVDLPFEEYRTLTNKVLFYVDKGEYALDQYVFIFYLVNRYGILNYDLDKLQDRFIKGINKGKSSFTSVKYPHSLVRNVDYGKNHMIEIEKYCMEVNEEIKEKEESERITRLFKLFEENLIDFIEKVDNPPNRKEPLSVFAKNEFDKFWSVIKSAKNSEVLKLGRYIKDEYSKASYSNQSPQKEFLEKLKAQLDVEINKNSTDKMTKAVYKILFDEIDIELKK